MIQRLLIPVITVSLTACGIAPMATPNGGTTLGKGVQELSVNAMPAPSVSFAFGVRDNTDVGAVVEQQISSNYGLWLKHSVLNNPQGFSAAGFAGVFKSGDGAHSQGFYLGPTFSYVTGKTELYSTVRYNRVYWDGIDDLSSTEQDDIWSDFKIDDQTFYYWQTDVGVNINTSDRVRLGLGATCLYIDGDSSCSPMIGMGLKL